MMKNDYSREIATRFESFLKENDWRYQFDEEEGTFRFRVGLHGKMQSLDFIIQVVRDTVLVYGRSPLSADPRDPQLMARMAEMIARANSGMGYGCFEMDYADGEIRYRVFLDCEGQVPSEAVIRNSIHATAAMFERYAPGILDILFGDASPREAVARCESNPDMDRTIAGTEDDNEVEAQLDRLLARLMEELDPDRER